MPYTFNRLTYCTCYILLIIIFLFSGCKSKSGDEGDETISKVWDFNQIKKSDTLTVITLNSSVSYFIYKDEPMGYDYDLCKDFCDEHGLELKIKIAENSTRLLEMLANGEGDLVAYPISIQNELKDSILYCGPEQISHQVLVQRADKGDTLITDQTELIGKEIYVKHNTKYHQRLVNLDAELGNGIIIRDIEKDTITTEDLIEMVSEGKIKYTVSDEYIARLNKTYYRNINVSLPLTFEQRSSWVVRRNTPKLAKELDKWIEENSYKPTYRALIKKYFELSKLPFGEDIQYSTHVPAGHISPFDNMFKKHAEGSGFDWRLLAAIAFQESRFETNLTSWAGATGLMGLMPQTAVAMGISVEDRTDPDLSIMASVKLLRQLSRLYSKIEDPYERIKFILAAYNGGQGHVADARALTTKYGGNSSVWSEVEKYLALKNNPEYYNDPVVKNGYFRAGETTNYVRIVLSNWEKFKERRPN